MREPRMRPPRPWTTPWSGTMSLMPVVAAAGFWRDWWSELSGSRVWVMSSDERPRVVRRLVTVISP